MKPTFFSYLKAAFNARPFGMFVAPNWLGLAAFGLLGLLNPGWWLIGAGVEAAYLFTLATNSRFQAAVTSKGQGQSNQEWQQKHDDLVRRLTDNDQVRYVAFVARCRTILDQLGQHDSSGTAVTVQSENLGKLSWVYLRLLLARRAMSRVLKDPAMAETAEIGTRLAELKERLKTPDLHEELKRSLSSQAEILEQRVAQRQEGRDKLEFLEAEISRIQEQVELLREQSALSADADGLSARIDAITGSLGGASQWMAEQQKMLGSFDDLLEEPPPVAARATLRAKQ